MKIVLQRVKEASVTVNNKIVGSINEGLLVLLGISETDTIAEVDKYVNKIMKLRIFSDVNDKTNLSIADVNGELLIISQFTLYADCRHGNRPSFVCAANPYKANELYEYFVKQCKAKFKKVQHGIFGAHMTVKLVNDGPFTIVLDSNEK